ncbi:MAG: beta-ketoacyl-[acyl-carrier-protein] synthase family protein [Myxococcales bacterium]|nr:beta-ketoacyl-[acyl-carrier-protein] synthase family protein [Myxococcales bacterium]
MTTRPRVAVTGLGAVTALGPDVASLDLGLRAGRCAISDLTLFDVSAFRTRLAAQAPDPTPPVDRLPIFTSRPDRFGLQAAFEAVRDAGLDAEALRGAACVFGTGTGGAELTYEYLQRCLTSGEQSADPDLLRSHQPCAVTDLVCRYLGIHGLRTTFMTACSSSATAIGYAGDQILLGRTEVAIAGGAEGLCMLTYAGFNALRATSAERCRPFDVARSGLNLGEGAAVLVLEREERALARGARIYGYLAGYGISADAYHMTAPHPEGDGAARAMRAALCDAHLSPDDVGYINAHGTATAHNDAAESAAVKQVFGVRAARIPISSTKSMIGHTLGAAGAVEAVTSLLAIHGRYLPPTANLENPDPAFSLDFIVKSAREVSVDVVLSSSFAFGGNNTVLVFSRS